MRKSALKIRDGAGVIEGLLNSGQYKRILEIGTYRGVTAAYMASFPVEYVITIDLVSGKMEWDEQLFDRTRLWEAMGADKVHLKLVRDNDDKAELIKTLDFDFAFVDGDHSYAGVSEDFRMVKRCGAVLFHDVEPGTDVARFVDALPPEQVMRNDLFAFWRDECKTC